LRTLNEVYSSLATRRRYEVWFLRLGLADGRGAWWFRYLLMNSGRSVCAGGSGAQPVQVWATWFPRDAKPQTFIQGFPLGEEIWPELSAVVWNSAVRKAKLRRRALALTSTNLSAIDEQESDLNHSAGDEC